MVVRRRSARKSKKVVHKRRASTIKAKVKDPGYMVQVNEPSLLRRDLLETLREVILFMQSYEKFKRVQQDKVHLFTSLKTDLKELNMLLGTKMKAHFPQGKLDAITEADEHNRIEKQHELEEGEIVESYDPQATTQINRPTGWTPETDDDSPINYERGKAEGSKTDEVMENKVIRTIKEVDDSGKDTMPLLATVVDEKEKESILDTKKVKTI